ncbi:MAG TPA: response regulator transcription factor [Magnetospirillaceae bacterium]|jgi:two-component system OmpR family response regulator
MSESDVDSLSDIDTDAKSEAERHPSILLVDDDLNLALDVANSLTKRGYLVSHAATAPDGLTQARRGAFDILILDRMLAGEDGLTVLKILRQEAMGKPVIILSALSGVEDRVRGLNAGGDDYLVKPFATDELVARVEALLRRTDSHRATLLQLGPLKLDLIDRRVWRGDREIELLPREFKLLEYFMHRPGQIVTRKMLLEDVWQYRFVPETRLVDVHVSKLRRKIEAADEPPMLLSIRSAGFMLNAPT